MESRSNILKEFVIGIIAGITSMLPGISGATMLVIMKVYERTMRDMSNLRVYLKKDICFLFFLLFGVAVGFIVAAKTLDTVIDEHPIEIMMLFIGLVGGQIPIIYGMCYTDGNNKKRSTADIVALIIGFVAIVCLILVEMYGGMTDIVLEHGLSSVIPMILVGIIVAISVLLPGVSHSTILVAIGLFGTFTGAVSDMDLEMLAPIAVGAIIGVLAFSKLIHNALENHHSTTMMAILGLTAGSIVTMFYYISRDSPQFSNILVGLIFLVVGLLLSYGLNRIGDRMELD